MTATRPKQCFQRRALKQHYKWLYGMQPDWRRFTRKGNFNDTLHTLGMLPIADPTAVGLPG